MVYIDDEITVERWILIGGLIAGFVVGYGAAEVEVAFGGPEYKAGYADGRAQAHYDLASFCLEHTRCGPHWVGLVEVER